MSTAASCDRYLSVCGWLAWISIVTCHSLGSHGVLAGEPVRVELSSAILKTVESTTIAAQASGVIESIQVKEGHSVKAGQELGRIHDAAVRLQVERAKAAVEVAKQKHKSDIDHQLASKSLAVADNEYQRALAANRRVKDTYTINEIDRLKLVVDRTKLEVERADYQRTLAGLEANITETEYRQALELHQRHRLTSAVSGVVISIEKHLGEWVEPGTALLRVERTDRLRVEGFISANDAVRKLVDQPAKVVFDGPNGPIESTGAVVFVSPIIDPIAATARVFIEIDNASNQLRSGLKVKASIELEP